MSRLLHLLRSGWLADGVVGSVVASFSKFPEDLERRWIGKYITRVTDDERVFAPARRYPKIGRH